jgi:hypothetical protein
MLHLHGNDAMVLPFRSPAVQKSGAFGSDYSLQVIGHQEISLLAGITLPTPHPSTRNKAQQSCCLAAGSLVGRVSCSLCMGLRERYVLLPER